MKLQTKPTRWTCLATAFAMALDLPVNDMFDWIGHDGSEVVLPGERDPVARRGHHIQECIDVCWGHGYRVTPIELFPQRKSSLDATPITIYFKNDYCENWRRFSKHLRYGRGVITGVGHNCGHAVAFEKLRIYDPDGHEYDYSREECEKRGFYTHCIWRVDR